MSPTFNRGEMGAMGEGCGPLQVANVEMPVGVLCFICGKRRLRVAMVDCDTCDELVCRETCIRTTTVGRQVRRACTRCADEDSDF